MNATDELSAPLAEAVAVALREMAAVESGLCEIGTGAPGEVSAIIPVATAAGAGYVALHFTVASANELARRVLARAEAGEGDDATRRDCLGEVANVVAGQAKTLLYGTPYHFTLSTPRIVFGDPARDDGARVLAFGSEIGNFVLHARLPT